MKTLLPKIIFYSVILTSVIDFSRAQNLVQNPSFESYTSCPTGNSGINLATPWDIPPGSGTTPDYMNACVTTGSGCNLVDVPDNFCGSAYAASGVGYAAIVSGFYEFCPNCREYIQSPLVSSLVAGTTYLVQMYVRPGDYNKYLTNNLGIFLSSTQISQPSNQPITVVTPQVESAAIISDTSQWTLVSGTFTASGGEQYITIGNFHDDTATLCDTVSFPGGSCILATNGSMYMIDSVYVGVAGMQLPSAGMVASDSGFCALTCIDFIDASANNPTSWQWEFPGGNPSTSTDQNPTNICYDAAGVYDVTLIVSNAVGGDTIVMSNFITVNPLPSATITQSNDTLFAPLTVSYQWYMGGSAIAGATNSYYTPSLEDYYSVIVVDSNGCSAADTILFTLAPFSSFSVPDADICEKFCTNFFDQSQNNPTTWHWLFSGGSPPSSTQQNPSSICYNTPGVFDVTLITTNAFGNDTLTLAGFMTVFATPPFPTISQVGYTLTSSPAGAYQWQFNTVDIAGATNQTYDVMQSGYYTVVVSDSNGCINSATIYVLIEGVDDVNGDGNIFMYPNPASDQLMVEVPDGSMSGEVSIELMNALGQNIFLSEEKISSPSFIKQIDLRNIEAGVYFITVKSESQFVRKKILITR